MKNIIIVGGGGHAKVLIDALCSSHVYHIHGIVDENFPVGSCVLGIEIIGSDKLLMQRVLGDCVLSIGVGMPKVYDVRRRLYQTLSGMGYAFPVIQHVSAMIAAGVVLGDGVQVMAGAIVQPDTCIGENCIINTASVVEHDCTIEAHVHIAPGAVLGGGVRVGHDSLIGIGARILPGITIGDSVTVAAGSVVVQDIPSLATVMGVPARVVTS